MTLSKQKQVYVVPTWQCNLHCPHCFVHKYTDTYNKEVFITKLKELKKKYPKASFILHGGEPTLYPKRYLEIMDTNIIDSICTNLITEPEIIEDLNKRDIPIATSWNPNRFNLQHYLQWLNNIKSLNNKPLVLITLDQDLLHFDIDMFTKVIKDLEEVGIEEILFEPLVDNTLTNDFQNKIDEWLCNIYTLWRYKRIKIKNLIEEQILHWDFKCNSITLLPDGTVRPGCIIGERCRNILIKCFDCKYAKVCRPCELHTRCSFYPKFYEKVKANA